MQLKQAWMLNSLRSAENFLDTNAAVLTGVVNSTMRQRLHQSITDLSGHASDQNGSSLAAMGATKKHQSYRSILLHDCMAPIAGIARVELANTPEIEPLRMPKTRTNVEQLFAAANGMAQAAEKHSQVFIDAGLPADFITTLRNTAQALLDWQQTRKASIGAVAGATEGIKVKLAHARQVVRALDTLVSTALKNDATLLRNWKQVKRVQQVSTTVQPVPAPTSAPSAVAA